MFLNGNTQPWLHTELLEELKKVLVPGSYPGPVESIWETRKKATGYQNVLKFPKIY